MFKKPAVENVKKWQSKLGNNLDQ